MVNVQSFLGTLALLGTATNAAAVALHRRDCSFTWPAETGDTCQLMASSWGISLEQFIRWNAGVDCNALVVGHEYCLLWNGPEPGDTTTSTTTTSETTPTSAPPVTTTESSTGPSPTQDGIASDCQKYHLAVSGDTCLGIVSKYGTFSQSEFYKWNPAVGTGCTSLFLGYYYCIAVTGTPTSPTTTVSTTTTQSAGNGIATPTPVMAGIPTNCNKFHLVKDTTTCAGIADYNKISLDDFFTWNPSIGKGCENLWLGYYMCAGIIGGTTISTSTTTTTTTTSAGNGIATPTPVMAGISTNCNKFHLVKDTTTCAGIADYNKISLDDFYKWNPSVGKGCENLWLGYYMCAGIIGGTTAATTAATTTTTSASNGIATPTPVMAGIPTNCNKFHLVRDTTTCAGIISYNGISSADFYKWNPSVGADCSNLWLGYNTCVGVIGSTTRSASIITTTKSAGNGIPTPTPVMAGIPTNCNKFHPVKDTTTCAGIISYNGISSADFYKWNPSVGADCSNLWLGYNMCVGVVGSTPTTTLKTTSTTTTTKGNGVATPTPVQANMVKSCKKFHIVGDGTTCQAIATYDKITLADFYKWNPDVGSNCENLWLGYYTCVAVL
ncbi:hypothetical protein C8A00DRAFT_33378 [Chaetomidium leptoderma]|uniref:LysM domain-containing protein n=1 Tax=Chaetomidium leptoderma TaxID=669021 RepID=A0AAN6ZXJ1_9PEZI|nr:hypothetical protein C8A00DRAFT_33378 [Chaetomidium leptoderma]